jgi:uncharacterized coiled-coil protein SlyX
MTDLITEARELCERAEALVNEMHTGRRHYETEYVPLIDAVQVISELCDALEKAENRIKLLEGAIERQNNTITYLNSANGQRFNWQSRQRKEEHHEAD